MGRGEDVRALEVMHAEKDEQRAGSLAPDFLQVSFSERMIPGREPELRLTKGSNCQRYADAVLRHFGLSVPTFGRASSGPTRSS